MDPVTISAVLAGGAYLYQGITTTFGGQDNLVAHSGKKFAHIVCSKPSCTAKHTSCCNKCESKSVNNCGKFAVAGMGFLGGFPGMGKNCSTCGCPNTDHCYAYADVGFPMFN